jgi:hypothetical protein
MENCSINKLPPDVQDTVFPSTACQGIEFVLTFRNLFIMPCILSIILWFCCIVFWSVCWSTVYIAQKLEKVFFNKDCANKLNTAIK